METEFRKIISFAIKNEQEAAELYRRLGSRARKLNARVMFQELAAEEDKHREFFEGITEEKIPDLPLQEVTDLKIGDYLVDVSFKPDMSYQDILIMAIKQEESAVRLYSDIAAKVKKPEVKRLLEFMIQEESRHKLRLETEYDDNILRED